MAQEYELTEEQYARLMDASKPTPAMWLSGGAPMFATAQENANRAWRELGNELAFDWQTARPVPGKTDRFFTAEPRPCPGCGSTKTMPELREAGHKHGCCPDRPGAPTFVEGFD